ncbi:DotU/TssL family secretion system protein [Paraburkholderia sp. GAS348]|uniref:DotU/TssL family secretion system protein n=1 Tax=Paraburkholderia sp. GAS348 TaxID=3035132 RepID=UPI003D1EE3DD
MIATASTYTTLLPVALRDTALTVTSLGSDFAPATSFIDFRKKCTRQIDELRAELTAAGHPREVVEDAAYAQCALLDEAALSTLKGSDRDAWEREPLQVVEFQSHDAGHELVRRIERRLAEPQPILLLLAIFGAVLRLGFTGKFALDGEVARTALIRTIEERLSRSSGPVDTRGSVIVSHTARRRWSGNLPAAGWVVIACAAAAIIYCALDQWLKTAIAGMTY